MCFNVINAKSHPAVCDGFVIDLVFVIIYSELYCFIYAKVRKLSAFVTPSNIYI